MPPAVQLVEIPSNALIVLIGVAGSGKSTFALAHFRLTEILSSDFFRAMVSDDSACQDATADAFDLLHSALSKRLRRGKLCVVDATNVMAHHRTRLLEQARSFARPAIALVLDTPGELCVQRAAARADRTVPPEIVRQQLADLERGIDAEAEGFSNIVRLKPSDQIEIVRTTPHGDDTSRTVAAKL